MFYYLIYYTYYLIYYWWILDLKPINNKSCTDKIEEATIIGGVAGLIYFILKKM